MNASEKIRQLLAQRLAEAEDFIDFLRAKNEEARFVASVTKVSEPSFASVWDNDEDAAYDRM
jgi:hypothetical protein